MRLRPRRVIAFVILAGIALYAFQAIRTLRPFYRPAPHGTEACARLGDMPGPEDMEVDPTTGFVWIAAADRRGGEGFRPRSGGVLVWRPGIDAAPIPVAVAGAPDLRPHGMSVYAPSGAGGSPAPKRLMLVHHGEGGDSVEILEVLDSGQPSAPENSAQPANSIQPANPSQPRDPTPAPAPPRLRHLRSVRDPLLMSLNDVAALGPDSFYATNDHGSTPGAGHTLEDFAFLSRASVIFHDGTRARTVAEGLRYANGVQVDRARPLVYVAETTALRMRVYARRPDGSLDELARHALDTAPDNFSIAPDGALLLAAHPSTFAFLRHAASASRRSPSQVLRLRLDDRGALTARDEIYLDSGDPISGSSIAVLAGGHLLIGGVFDPYLLRCPSR